MFRKISAAIIAIAISATFAFSGTKTEFKDGNPALGQKGTVTTAEYLNKTSYGVPTGEDQQGSFPPLYSLDSGTTNSFSIILYQGKTRVVSTNTGTAANKLIDSLATFQTLTVTTGDVVLNLTDRTSTTVTAIDSQTQLSLAADIFTATSKSYAVGRDIQQLPQAYTAGLTVAFKAANANTGASTLDVNGLGPKAIKKKGADALISGDIPAGAIVELAYDGTNFQMLSTPIMNSAPSLTDGTYTIKAKAFDIGVWNMDADATKVINTSIPNENILGAVGIIRADDAYADMSIFIGGGGDFFYNESVDVFIMTSNNSNQVTVARKDAGTFDSTNFDSTAQSRGKIMVFYFE